METTKANLIGEGSEMVYFSKNEQFKDRRKNRRDACFAAIAYDAKGITNMEYVHDLSAWGVFIRTKDVIPVGENVTITLLDPDVLSNVRVVGEVVRSTPYGIGIKFTMGIDDAVLKSIVE